MSSTRAVVRRTAAELAEEAIATLVGLRLDDGRHATWPARRIGRPGEPARTAAEAVSFYDGDAGIGWALAVLGRALDRPELTALARKANRRVQTDVAALAGEGLLAGRAGARLTAYACGEVAPADWGRPVTADVAAGAAGVLLAQVRTQARLDPLLVRCLARAAQAQEVGWAWCTPDPLARDPRGRPLCGLAHGASGVVLALVEAAAVAPGFGPVPALAVGGLDWESDLFDSARGWPDLRREPSEFTWSWCHGGAGATAVRLRLLQLARRGADLGMPLGVVQAQAEAGLELCRAHLRATIAAAAEGMPPRAGLSLCHGLGGALDALVLGAEVLGSAELLGEAEAALLAAAALMGPDVLAWPCGDRQPGSVGLFLGLAGVAVVAARIAWPQAGIPSPSLLG